MDLSFDNVICIVEHCLIGENPQQLISTGLYSFKISINANIGKELEFLSQRSILK